MMARKGIAVRTLRTGIVRLGYQKKSSKGSNYPSDTDVFVMREKDGITPAIKEAYDAAPIRDAVVTPAGGTVFALGKNLRCMLPWEFDAVVDGREVALETRNAAWTFSKLRCVGDGNTRDDPGTASCRDEGWAKRIGNVAGGGAEPNGKGFKVTCLGSDCPKWLRADPHDEDAACHLEMRLQVILLHPTTDPEHPQFMKQLGWVQLVSGSWNGTVDVKSGFTTIRAIAKRTALVPFTLRRIPRSIPTPDGKRVTKATLIVDFDSDEILRYGFGPPGRALLRPAVRRELLDIAKQEAEYEQLYRDIDPAARALAGKQEAAPAAVPALPAAREQVGHDRDQAIENAQAGTTDEPDAPPDWRKLSQDERDDLKKLCGGVPGNRESLTRFREMVESAYRVIGVPRGNEWGDYPGTAPGHSLPLDLLQNRHYDWITEKLVAEEEARATAAEPDPDEEQGSDVPLVQGQLV